jgi:hypothetical protein
LGEFLIIVHHQDLWFHCAQGALNR